VAHTQNDASLKALASGAVNSASIMAPCPWLPEIANFVRSHAEKYDLGMHLTLTSEWKLYKWGPVASRDQVSSLVDSSGYFYNECDVLAAHLKLAEVETELRAQIERAKQMGIQPTHLDSHMGCLFWTNVDLFKIYLRLGREYHLPLLLSRDLLDGLPPAYRQALAGGEVIIDHAIMANPEDYHGGMTGFYEKALHNLQPGVSEMIIHLAYDDREMQGVSYEHPDWGAAWRQADFDFFTSPACKKILEAEHIRLITWKEIGRLLK
jgi:hypothetical protein